MSKSQPSESEVLPPSRFILDLDQELQLQALLEILQLCQDAPESLRKQPHGAAWLSRVWVRSSYLLSKASLTRRLDSRSSELQVLAREHEFLARSLRSQEEALSLVSTRTRRTPG